MKEIHFDVIDSTNTYLKNNYLSLDDFTFVSASFQTQGRGREKRQWYSSKDNLQFSLLIKDKEIITHYKELSIVTSFTILKVLENYGLKNIMIKWPNDIYVNDKKIAGILLEAISNNELECLIIGIGLNVNETLFNGDYLHEPTSLKKQLHYNINLSKLKDEIYLALINNIRNISFDYYPQISQYDYLKDKEAFALIDNKKTKIKVIGINKDYSLTILNNNHIQIIETGEISFHI